MAYLGMAAFPHPAVQLQYMEICVRYCAFFDIHPALTPGALEHFVQLVHHEHPRVRTRSWYLFHRFVKHLRNQLSSVAETVIRAVSDLLEVEAELPKRDVDDDIVSSEGSDESSDTTFNSQLYLFEAIGCIASTATVPVEQQVLFARAVDDPLLLSLERHLPQAKLGNEKAVLQVHHVMMALGTLARGFSDGRSETNSTSGFPAQAVGDEFERIAEAVLATLETLRSSASVRMASRFVVSRILEVIGARILPQLPRLIEGLLSESSSKDEMTTFLRLLEQIIYRFKLEMYNILDALLTPLLQRVFAHLSEPTAGTDDAIDLAELRREYLNFISVVFQNDTASVFLSSCKSTTSLFCRDISTKTSVANQGNLENLIASIEVFAKDISDLPTVKVALIVLNEIASRWGGSRSEPPSSPTQPTSPTSPTTSTFSSAPASVAAAIPGFDRFMIERFTAVSWSLPTNPAFDHRDAQTRQIVMEIATLQKTIFQKTGQEYITYLQDMYFPGMQLDKAAASEYLQALQTKDLKGFRQFFVVSIKYTGVLL